MPVQPCGEDRSGASQDQPLPAKPQQARGSDDRSDQHTSNDHTLDRRLLGGLALNARIILGLWSCHFRSSRLIGHGEGRLVSFISARKCAGDSADNAVQDIPYRIG